MITLVKEKYCENCPSFKPFIKKDIHDLAQLGEYNEIKVDTFIECKYAERCKCIYKQMKKESFN